MATGSGSRMKYEVAGLLPLCSDGGERERETRQPPATAPDSARGCPVDSIRLGDMQYLFSC